jgi:hypothetical protein
MPYAPSATWWAGPFDPLENGETVDYDALIYSASADRGLMFKAYDRTEYLKTSPTIVSLTTTGAVVVGTTLGVTGAATLSSTLGVTGAVTGASFSAGGDITAGTSGGGGTYKLQSRSVVRTAIPIFLNTTTSAPGLGSLTIGVSETGYQAIDLPHGATLTKVTIAVDPSNASPPAGTPVVGSVVKRSLITGGAVSVIGGPTTDTTAGASYGNHHQFDVTASEVIDRDTYVYFVQLDGETGGGAAAAAWYGSTWTCTMTELDIGGA